MQKKYFNVVLVSVTNPAYLAFSRGKRTERNSNRCETFPDPQQALSVTAEQFARDYLTQYIKLSENRVLSYKTRSASGTMLASFTELDAVCVHDRESVTIFEIKHSSRRASIKKARKQLMRAEEILSGTYKQVNKVAIIIEPSDFVSQPEDDKQIHLVEFNRDDSKYKILNHPIEGLDPDKTGLLLIKGTGIVTDEVESENDD